MSKTIDLTTTTDLLARRHDEFMGDDFYRFGPDESADLDDIEWARAREQWTARAGATYETQGQVTTLMHRMLSAAVPVEIISGVVDTLQNLHRHAVWSATLASGLGAQEAIRFAPQRLGPGRVDEPSASHLEIALDLLNVYGFNFTISLAIFDACCAITSDKTISEMTEAIGDDLSGHVEYGWEALKWVLSGCSAADFARFEEAAVQLLGAYEDLSYAGPEILDDLAGQEIIVESQEANLGTLSSTQYAAIFYHTVTEQFFPRFDRLGVNATEAWHKHYRLRQPQAPRHPSLMGLRAF